MGITTAYLAGASKASNIFTLEGSKNTAAIAQENFAKLGLQNINLIHGSFDDRLPGLLLEIQKADLAFVDGNHRKIPTLQYFQQFLQKSTDQSIFIFDDIHWSSGMEEAWKEIQDYPSVTLTIDLFL